MSTDLKSLRSTPVGVVSLVICQIGLVSWEKCYSAKCLIQYWLVCFCWYLNLVS